MSEGMSFDNNIIKSGTLIRLSTYVYTVLICILFFLAMPTLVPFMVLIVVAFCPRIRMLTLLFVVHTTCTMQMQDHRIKMIVRK